MGVSHGGFASSSSQPFASVSHDGVLRVCFFSSLDTIHLVFGRALFLITEAATFPIVTTKSLAVHGSTSFIKEKRISTYRTTFRRDGAGVFVLRPWCSRSSWGIHGQLSGVGVWVGKDIVRFCCWGISGAGISGSVRRRGRLWSWLIFPFFILSISLYHGLMVGSRGLLPLLYPYFYFPVWIF